MLNSFSLGSSLQMHRHLHSNFWNTNRFTLFINSAVILTMFPTCSCLQQFGCPVLPMESVPRYPLQQQSRPMALSMLVPPTHTPELGRHANGRTQMSRATVGSARWLRPRQPAAPVWKSRGLHPTLAARSRLVSRGFRPDAELCGGQGHGDCISHVEDQDCKVHVYTYNTRKRLYKDSCNYQCWEPAGCCHAVNRTRMDKRIK